MCHSPIAYSKTLLLYLYCKLEIANWKSRRLAAEGVGMLFGHQNNDNNQPAQNTPAPATPPIAPPPAPTPGVNPLAVDPDTGASLPSITPVSLDQPEPSVLAQPTLSSHPAAPVPAIDTVNTSTSLDAPDPVTETSAPVHHDAPAGSDDLLHLKQQAISQLSPLVGKLDQSPEEKFRTTMMLIQSTDNQLLLQEAYDAAQKITDEKARAQALLDVVNEINYFTQQKSDA
jgi:hypothetical protein